MTPSTSLSAIDAVTSVSGPAREVRPEVVERAGEGRGTRRVVGPVEQDVAAVGPRSSSSRPGQRAPAYPARRAAASVVRDPGRLQRVEQRVGDGDVGGLVPAAQPDPRRARAAAARRRSRRGPSRGAAPAATSVSGTPSRARAAPDRPRAPSPRAPVTARSPRLMIAAFSRAIAAIVVAEPVRVVEVHVRHDRDAAVPGVGRVEPPAEADLDERDVGRTSANRANTTAVSSSNSVGSPWRRATRSATRERPAPRAARSRPARSARPSTTIRSRYVTRCGLGVVADPVAGRAQRGIGERQDAALAVRAGDEGAADGQLRVAQLPQERAGPPEPEPDPEAAALGRGPRAPARYVESGRRSVIERGVTRGSARPRRRRTG